MTESRLLRLARDEISNDFSTFLLKVIGRHKYFLKKMSNNLIFIQQVSSYILPVEVRF